MRSIRGKFFRNNAQFRTHVNSSLATDCYRSVPNIFDWTFEGFDFIREKDSRGGFDNADVIRQCGRIELRMIGNSRYVVPYSVPW